MTELRDSINLTKNKKIPRSNACKTIQLSVQNCSVNCAILSKLAELVQIFQPENEQILHTFSEVVQKMNRFYSHSVKWFRDSEGSEHLSNREDGDVNTDQQCTCWGVHLVLAPLRHSSSWLFILFSVRTPRSWVPSVDAFIKQRTDSLQRKWGKFTTTTTRWSRSTRA